MIKDAKDHGVSNPCEASAEEKDLDGSVLPANSDLDNGRTFEGTITNSAASTATAATAATA